MQDDKLESTSPQENDENTETKPPAPPSSSSSSPPPSTRTSSPQHPPPQPQPPYHYDQVHTSVPPGAHHMQPTYAPSIWNSAPMWVTAGAVLGVSAAAAVRWLNGGDFCLFPPATTSIKEEEDEHENRVHKDMSVTEEDTNNRLDVLHEDLQSLIQVLRDQTVQQQAFMDKYLAQQQRQESRTMVNQSMDLLVKQKESQQEEKFSVTNPQSKREAPLSIQLNTHPKEDHPELSKGEEKSSFSANLERSGQSALGSALQRLSNENSTQVLQNGLPLLTLYVQNLANNPNAPRYRKIFTTNESFQTRIQPMLGGVDLLMAVGFELSSSQGCWEWLSALHDNDDNDDKGVKEAEHLEYLKDAAHALQALQKQQPLQGQAPSTSLSSNYSPLRSLPTSKETAAFYPQTPPNPSIQSPPVPKKQIYFEDEALINGRDKDETKEESSRTKTSEANASKEGERVLEESYATSTMWK